MVVGLEESLLRKTLSLEVYEVWVSISGTVGAGTSIILIIAKKLCGIILGLSGNISRALKPGVAFPTLAAFPQFSLLNFQSIDCPCHRPIFVLQHPSNFFLFIKGI